MDCNVSLVIDGIKRNCCMLLRVSNQWTIIVKVTACARTNYAHATCSCVEVKGTIFFNLQHRKYEMCYVGCMPFKVAKLLKR